MGALFPPPPPHPPLQQGAREPPVHSPMAGLLAFAKRIPSLPGTAAGTRQVTETLLAWSQTSFGPIFYFISAKNYRDARDDEC